MQFPVAIAASLIVIHNQQCAGHCGDLKESGSCERHLRLPTSRSPYVQAMRAQQHPRVEAARNNDAHPDKNLILTHSACRMFCMTGEVVSLMLHPFSTINSLELVEIGLMPRSI